MIDRDRWHGNVLSIYSDGVWCTVFAIRRGELRKIDGYRTDARRADNAFVPMSVFLEALKHAAREFGRKQERHVKRERQLKLL